MAGSPLVLASARSACTHIMPGAIFDRRRSFLTQLLSKRWAILPLILLLIACVPSQVLIQTATAETQSVSPSNAPTAIVSPTATVLPTTSINPCTDRGWTDISNYVAEFKFQVMNIQQGVIVSEWLKTVTSIKENIINVTVDACTEHARQLVVSSLDNRISWQHMVFTGQFDDPNAVTNGVNQENQMMEAARTELTGLGLNVTLP